VVWIAEHMDLRGDNRLGPEKATRFLPSRFTPEGDAIDARGQICQQTACPKCHLTVPRGMLEMEPLFLSVLGTPGSGKSYFLTTATWKLRQLLPSRFGVTFNDADPIANNKLVEDEEKLFLSHEPDEVKPLWKLIYKTEFKDPDLYDEVTFGTHTVTYSRPYLFDLRVMDHHPGMARGVSLSRTLCLYDNAGEYFLPGADSATQPARHIALSRALLFVYDPTQDMRFREACKRIGVTLPKPDRDKMFRQETTLNEATARVRKYAGLGTSARNDRLLIMVVSKYDAWSRLLDTAVIDDPWIGGAKTPIDGLKVEVIEEQSAALRRLLQKICPEILGAAEGFSRNIVFIPVSAVGDQSFIDAETGKDCIRPEDVRPHWVTVPFLYALHKSLPGLIGRVRRRADA
jgi:hypothetical protein